MFPEEKYSFPFYFRRVCVGEAHIGSRDLNLRCTRTAGGHSVQLQGGQLTRSKQKKYVNEVSSDPKILLKIQCQFMK